MQADRTNEVPYVGLAPYSEEQARFFFGRGTDRQIVVANLYAARLTLLYGPSGVGKSSLLRAGVASYLHHQPRQQPVVVFSTWPGNPVAGLKAAIRQELRTRLGLDVPEQDELPLDQFLARYTAELETPLLIILDQFEEYFLYHPDNNDPGSFAAQFARAINTVNLPLSFLIALREDALAKLDRFEDRVPGLFDNYLRLDHLTREAGAEAIRGPLEVYNRSRPPEQHVAVEEALVDAVLTGVELNQISMTMPGRSQAAIAELGQRTSDSVRIEAPYLQLVLDRLWAEERLLNSRRLRLSTLAALGGPEQIVRKHVDTVLRGLGYADQEVAAQIFFYLVTPSGMKIALAADDLERFTGIDRHNIERVVKHLSASEVRVLRAVEQAASTPSVTRYEIFHDNLAPAINDWSARHLRRVRLPPRSLLIIPPLALAIFGFGNVIPLARPLTALVRFFTLFLVNYVPLLQLYRWLTGKIRLTVPSFSMNAYSLHGVPILLSLLMVTLYHSSTEWLAADLSHPISPLGSISIGNYVIYLIFTSLQTCLLGLLSFLLMRRVGYLTQWLSRAKSFNLGFYGAFAAICGIFIALIVAAVAAHVYILPQFSIE